MNKNYYVYILSNQHNNVLYVGMTSNLKIRIFQHKQKIFEGFTKKYNVTKLVYFEQTGEVLSAINREKQLKSGSRKKKVELISDFNSTWRDLYEDL